VTRIARLAVLALLFAADGTQAKPEAPLDYAYRCCKRVARVRAFP